MTEVEKKTEKYPHAWAALIAFIATWCLCGAIGIYAAATGSAGSWLVWAATVTLIAGFVSAVIYAKNRWGWDWDIS